VRRLADVDVERLEMPGEDLPVDQAVVDDQGDGLARAHLVRPASANAASVAAHAVRASSTSSRIVSVRAARPSSSIALQIAERRIAPRLALLDSRVWAGRTTAAASSPAAAATMPSMLTAPSLT